nr:vacuolar protein sorting-associated protein vps5 [Quercus suber]
MGTTWRATRASSLGKQTRNCSCPSPVDFGCNDCAKWWPQSSRIRCDHDADVPSRSHSHQSLPQAAAEEEAQTERETPAGTSPTMQQPAAPSTTPTTNIPTRQVPSKSRPKRHGNLTQSTTLESLDDSMGPLGPLGQEPIEEASAPTPPVKEIPSRTRQTSARPGTASTGVSLDNESAGALNGARVPPPVQPAQMDGRPRQPQPSMSVEQAAMPTFNITVGDPHTVGNAATSHTVYSVITRTTSKAYTNPTFTVTRRYRDFLWLYERLHDNNPGVVVPPPPEKQAVGRFDTNFVESRRMALERMVNKVAAHNVLQHDGDLKTFLESESFNVDIKHKNHKDPLLGTESKGFMSSIGISSGSGGKFIEHDDWFHDRRIYLDALENQLKALQKSTDTVVGQRKALADSCGDFSTSLHNLAAVELSPALSGPLDALGDLQIRVQELYNRQAMQDVLTLGIVIDEYIRLIGSVKKAFEQRQKSFHSWHSAESKLQETRKQQDKLLRAGRTQQDRIGQMQADVADAERRVHATRLLFEDMGRLMRQELERFEREKVEDFKSGVETFLESAVEAQKELIELWETYLLQLDSDEDGPPIMPAGVTAHAEANSAGQVQPEASEPLPGENGTEQHVVPQGFASLPTNDEEPRLSGTTARDSEDLSRESEETARVDE